VDVFDGRLVDHTWNVEVPWPGGSKAEHDGIEVVQQLSG